MKKKLQHISLIFGVALVAGCSTVKFTTNNGGTIIGDDNQTIWFGGDAEEVYARPKDGYYFVKWKDEKARSDHRDNPLTLRNVDESRIVIAQFAPSATARTKKMVSTREQSVTGYQIQTPEEPIVKKQENSEQIGDKKSEALIRKDKIKQLENIRYLTKTMPARLAVQVVGDSNYSAITRAVEGSIANAGYEVVSDSLTTGRNENPFLSVILRNSLGQFDKFGNYYIYKGKTELTIKRNVRTATAVKTVLARETISGKGQRKLGKGEAIKSLVDNLGEQAAEYVKRVCRREMAGVVAENITLRKEAIRRAFGENMGQEQRIISAILKRAAKIDGVISIHQVATDLNTFTIEAIYRKKSFPNGLVHDYIDGNIVIKSSDPVGEFMRYIFKI